jgi:Zn-dependent protease
LERAEPGPPNPLAWSFPLVRLAGTRFRVHFSFAVYALVVVLRAAFGPTGSDLGLRVVAECVGALLVLVLLRETVRAIVVRAAGGSADDVVLWPLGNLEGFDPAPGWRSALNAAVAGFAGSAVLLAGLGAALAVATGDWRESMVLDPTSAAWLANPHPWWVELLWVAHWTNTQLTILVLLPMIPLDGGRIAEAFILRRRGEADTPRASAAFGLAACAVVGLVAIVRDLPTLLTVAIACAGYAAFQLYRLRQGDAIGAQQGAWTVHADHAREEAELARAEAAEREAKARAREQAAAAEQELDRILAKIGRDGQASLTARERATLEAATRARRQGGG